jgi:hypothetical protein
MKTENLFNALLALALAEKTEPQQIPTQQIPTQQIPTQQIPTQQIPTQQIPTQQNPYDLGAQIEALTKAVQSNAIMHSEQPKAMTADEALASIINPPQKGSEK